LPGRQGAAGALRAAAVAELARQNLPPPAQPARARRPGGA